MPVAIVKLENVVQIKDYQAPGLTGPCIVEFVGFEFKTPEDVVMRLNFSVAVADGDFETAIDHVRRNGGIYVPAEDGAQTHWFLPWPCAAVRIRTQPQLSS